MKFNDVRAGKHTHHWVRLDQWSDFYVCRGCGDRITLSQWWMSDDLEKRVVEVEPLDTKQRRLMALEET